MPHNFHWQGKPLAAVLLAIFAALLAVTASAHGVSGTDAAFLERSSGINLPGFTYLGAKHMVTGYDHLLYLTGVIFFLRHLRDVALYVTLFALGHSITLLTGVLAGLQLNAYIVDAVIGLSIVYKAFENLGGFRACFGVQPNPKGAVFLFGLVHGFGLATKLQDLALSDEGLVANMIAFNVGVEIGQLLALVFLLTFFNIWRSTPGFAKHAYGFNVLLMFAGFALFGYQTMGFFYE
ncbi:MAG: HupE/UreJ family protein [Gammaproteobacteria bacterium]|nr:HupE/UreJ family protein [Gammaproteobacteria bacterium]